MLDELKNEHQELENNSENDKKDEDEKPALSLFKSIFDESDED